ncbi:hypothetical protein ASPWEDRAFT_41700 [Aspergillus wentii DTO 134E9]|uniref:Uncharacterized protein n=1 Tax=Aspergillus wentii DTO 134E9 TaxID=1073089 RepID=A0A1L9RG46_ASPWE|nr:uncharacterized protein ASPWEDRAFT_41700 [Aspergillus wentii DTO 134E9]KAI9925582.1 hypothetical protein MW887_005964 [Aspergillus wentii]OJJ33823.1 hypothetical protein ASPWEDRAFT_41700 [Aspergillus wentii DTO 134E9]
MGFSLRSLILLTCISTSTSASALPPSSLKDSLTFPPNANHVFNAIQDSMRQWGSSLHHNGMSFFLATVPAGTQFYHGDASSDPVTGREWLAFEPEHAMVFARSHLGPPPPPSDKADGERQKPLSPPPPPPKDDGNDEPGWLHTYIAAKNLRLLYVDGMSAAKTTNGTLDLQDLVLFNGTLGTENPMQERARADLFCKMARETWGDRLDGLLRMEAGFEIILCSFERDLKEVRVTQTKRQEKGKGKGGKPGMPGGDTWIKAITARYGGIGGDRVRINQEDFVTAYNYGLDLFPGNESKLPRLSHLPLESLQPIRADLHNLIMNHDTAEPSFNWQSIADMVVERYAHSLHYLISPSITTTSHLHAELERLLAPFIDYSARNVIVEADRCANQFIPAQAPTEGTASRAVQSIAHTICQSLLRAWEETDFEDAVAGLRNLVEYLSWSTWKECRGCADNEVCVIPIWPMGTVEDYESPKCKDATKPEDDGTRYWGGHGPPGSKHGRHGDGRPYKTREEL